MGFLAITPSISSTTGEVTYTSAVPANGVTVTGIVLREFMTNGPTKNADGTYNATLADLVFDVKVRPNSVTATITVTSGGIAYQIIMLKTPEGIQQSYKFATGDTIKVNAVVAALITDA